MIESTFKSSIAFLQKMFGYNIDDDVYLAYWNILKKYPDEAFLTMQENIIKSFVPTSQVPFPLIKHFLGAIGLSPEKKSRMAIMAIRSAAESIGSYRTVSFGDPALHDTINRFGGWPVIARWYNEEWQFNEKNFIACYEAAQSSGWSNTEKCEGIFEIGNNSKSLPTERMKEIASKQSVTQKIEWVGFDKMLENKTEKKEIKCDEFINSLIENIGDKF